MNRIKPYYRWIVSALLVVILIFGYSAFQLSNPDTGFAASASSPRSVAASPAQLAAIQGAQQLLLLQPTSPILFLPVMNR
jgi:hypothetical protein